MNRRLYVLEERSLLAGGAYVVSCVDESTDRAELLERMAQWIAGAQRSTSPAFRRAVDYAATGGRYRLVLREVAGWSRW